MSGRGNAQARVRVTAGRHRAAAIEVKTRMSAEQILLTKHDRI